ncbi:hypothetical protein [Humibacter ginsenosidimutans]|uniref:Uncharacterized protein n=1 Tax=Humibacter ginsenosidimutans TaxID=2599293 RepID=A0A5B8M1X1_9MICO|nr:hypothetical protein [Humibacter ginsenosidimutans]QDZ14041.1 hypothetical protein FPZ11_03925 [Humibacter ginsenosidimutans]
MQWWNDFWDWFTSSDAQPVIFTGAVILVSIIVSGLLSAWIARGAIRGLLTRSEREQKAAAVAALVDAAVEASVWNSLTPAEQVLSDRSVGQADILVRLLPVKGAGVAADWVAHQLSELKRNSATYGYSLEPAIVEFRDRLVEWQNKPRRARRLFLEDLQRWRFERTSSSDAAGVEQQQDAWVAREHHDRHAEADAAPADVTHAAEPAAASADSAPEPIADTQVLDDYEIAGPVGAYSARKSTGLEAD